MGEGRRGDWERERLGERQWAMGKGRRGDWEKGRLGDRSAFPTS
jgi:hypothetical protein